MYFKIFYIYLYIFIFLKKKKLWQKSPFILIKKRLLKMSGQQQIMEQILSKIKEYKRIILTRHIRPDGDAIGASRGLGEIIRATFPDKEVYVQTDDKAEYLSFLGSDDDPINPELYKDSLLIVLDTATEERISNKHYRLAKEIIKIDHHIEKKPYGKIRWVEDWRTSACEMITYFYQTYKNELKITPTANKLLYTGIVVDTDRFRLKSTTGNAMRLAAMLLDNGIDTENLYSNLYLKDFDHFKFQSYVLGKIKVTPNGVVYLHIDKNMKNELNLTDEQASKAIYFYTDIKDCIVQLSFISMEDGTIRVMLRSRFMKINTLAEKFGGGGHEDACGATLHEESEIQKMIDEADKMLGEYKATHKGYM